jgi:hypothetical protein
MGLETSRKRLGQDRPRRSRHGRRYRGRSPERAGARPYRYSESPGARRRCLIPARRSFSSRILRFKAGGRGERCRRAFSFSALRRFLSSAWRLSNNSTKRDTAMARFWCWERESVTVTESPVGICRNVTAVATLLTFWPPGPPDRAKDSSNCDSLNPSRWSRSRRPWSTKSGIWKYSPQRRRVHQANDRSSNLYSFSMASVSLW